MTKFILVLFWGVQMLETNAIYHNEDSCRKAATFVYEWTEEQVSPVCIPVHDIR